MGFGMFSTQHSAIAIDIGSASVKMLQIGTGDQPMTLASAETDVPDGIRSDPEQFHAFIENWVQGAKRDFDFKGKRAVVAVPAAQTFIQHMQINESELVGGISRDDVIKTQLQTQMGCPPHGVVVRPMEVCAVHRNGQSQKEVICFAIARDTVMRYVELLKKCKMEVVGVHTDTQAMVRAFDHIHRRAEDVNVTTLFIDMGWGGTRAAIAHGKQIVFARHIPIGGKHFDQLVAGTMKLEMGAARTHRLALRSAKTRSGSGETNSQPVQPLPSSLATKAELEAHSAVAAVAERRTGAAPPELQCEVTPVEGEHPAVSVDLTELLETMTDELSMCLRYHQGLFPQRPINRAIFVGGEARQSWACQHIVKALRLPGQLGDPMARLTPPENRGSPRPEWAVACGLCVTPANE